MHELNSTYKIEVSGTVQGVGFRPFIYKLAGKYNINGEVFNTTSSVIIKANISSKLILNKFINEIKNNNPPAAFVDNILVSETQYKKYEDFKIIGSLASDDRFQLISPDLAVCNECLKELTDNNNNRRYRYPFANCTNCGPRFTIIKFI